eukprot:64341-Rhodomonas_salina.1
MRYSTSRYSSGVEVGLIACQNFERSPGTGYPGTRVPRYPGYPGNISAGVRGSVRSGLGILCW